MSDTDQPPHRAGRYAAGALLLALSLLLAALAPARAEGTWPATVTLDPATAVPTQTVGFSGQGPADVGEGTCVVELDGAAVPDARCSWTLSGAISGDFAVPAGIKPATLRVSVCWPDCLDDAVDDVLPAYWQAETTLEVASPTSLVPDVRCRTVREAAVVLRKSGFRFVGRSDLTEVVTAQEPDPGTLLSTEVPVALIVLPVPVPDLTGRSYADAEDLLATLCLRIRSVGDRTDGTVEAQRPTPDRTVPGGALVVVRMATPPPPPPPPQPPVDPEPASFPTGMLLGALVGVLALVAGSLLANRLLRPRRELTWVAEHVDVVPRPGAASVTSAPTDPSGRDHLLAVHVLPAEPTVSTTTSMEE